MKATFRPSFTRDVKKVKDEDVRDRIREAIEEAEAAARPQDISGFKKLSGAKSSYRIRIGEYRIGVAIEGDTIDFVWCLPRRDCYR